jgi:DNA processing protein
MTESEAYFAVNLVPHLGPIRVRRLAERLGSVEAILNAPTSKLQEAEGIGRELASKIYDGIRALDLDREKARVEEHGLQLITFADDNYPTSLREIYDPPLVLYAKGKVPSPWPRGVAVVGSRMTSSYGIEMAKKLSYQIAYAGVPVISGLARGIDTCAHQGALAAKGVTWAVIGCGLDQMYPPENQPLADLICEKNGCVLSEFALGTPPDKRTFPMRNRIVSGLSFGVLVIEAGRESGALITARQALEQGRQVYAVPGRIDNPQAKGCHQLIKEGATLVEGVEDILASTEFLLPMRDITVPRPAPENLTEIEAKVFDAIERDETPIDVITQKTGLPSGAVSSTLLRLEMRKLVKQLPGKIFVRTA